MGPGYFFYHFASKINCIMHPLRTIIGKPGGIR